MDEKSKKQEILSELLEIKNRLLKVQYNNDLFLDNQEFLLLMNISKRTAQTWRDSGVIPYSQIGAKIYYKYADISKLIDKNYVNTNSHEQKKN